MKTHQSLFLIAGFAMLLGGAAAAQDTKQPEQPAEGAKTEPTRPAPVWTDPQPEKIGAMLAGPGESDAALGAGGASLRGVVCTAPGLLQDPPHPEYCGGAR